MFEGGGHRIKTALGRGLLAAGARKMAPGGLGRKILKSPNFIPMAGMAASMLSDNPTVQMAGMGMSMLGGGGRTPAAMRRGSPAKKLPHLSSEQQAAANHRWRANNMGPTKQKTLF